MTYNEIKDFLRGYGVYERADGFKVAVELINLALVTKEKKVNKLVKHIAEQRCKSISTINNELRYAITQKNIYGGNLTVKELVKLALHKQEERGL